MPNKIYKVCNAAVILGIVSKVPVLLIHPRILWEKYLVHILLVDWDDDDEVILNYNILNYNMEDALHCCILILYVSWLALQKRIH